MSEEFDCFSENYRTLLDKTVRLTGNNAEYFAELKARYLARLLGRGFSGKVLDFGCGVGLLSKFLLAHLPKCTLHGYDPSSACIEHVDRTVYSRGTFTWQDDRLDSAYDLIVVANVLHHVRVEDRSKTIVDLCARLAPGGYLATFEHNPANPLTRWAVHACPFDKNAVLLWPAEVKNLTRGCLHNVKLDYITFFPRWAALFYSFEPFLAWCPIGAQYAVVGTKHRC